MARRPAKKRTARKPPGRKPAAKIPEDPQVINHVYRPDGPILRAFYTAKYETGPSKSFILGPVGSGKTRCMFMRMFRHMREAYPCRDGKRRTRWLVVRNTYPQLDESTIKDFDDIFVNPFPKDQFGKWKLSTPKTFTFDFDDVHAEVTFMAFEDETSISQAKSMQLTGVVFHEARFLLRAVVGNLIERTGRYPAKEEIQHNFPDGTPHEDMAPQWYGCLADTNMPQNRHWLTVMAGLEPIPPDVPLHERTRWEKPADWHIYLQPPGLRERRDAAGNVSGYEANPRAENLKWLPGGSKYYTDKIGEGRAYVDSQILNKPAIDRKGTPVHGDYNDQVHYVDDYLEASPDLALIGGIDFGTYFALELAQHHMSTWTFVDELFLEATSTEEAAIRVRSLLAERYPAQFSQPSNGVTMHPGIFLFCGDDGKFKTSYTKDLLTHIDIFRKHGLEVHIAPGGNRLTTRCAALDTVLRRFPMGRPAFRIGKRNPMFRTGLQSGYVWKSGKSEDGVVVFKGSMVDKDSPFAHSVEAGHYCVLGGGEGGEALGHTAGWSKACNYARAVDPFDRGKPMDVFAR